MILNTSKIQNCKIYFDTNGNYLFNNNDTTMNWVGHDYYNINCAVPNGITKIELGRYNGFNRFNARIDFPKTVVNMINCFSYKNFYNQSPNLPNYVVDATRIFSGCQKLNSPVTMPDSITNAEQAFGSCERLNQPVHLSNNLINGANLFAYCNNFNQPVNIPESIRVSAGFFRYCYNFNQPVEIPDQVQNCSFMFTACTKFNYPVKIPSAANNIVSMFDGCPNFNASLDLSNLSQGANIGQLVQACSIYNSKVIFSNNALVMNACFKNCFNFNMPVNAVVGGQCDSIFENCYNFNQPINITATFYLKGSANYRNVMLRNMLWNAYAFNSTVDIQKTPQSINVRLDGLFNNCIAFNRSINNILANVVPGDTDSMLRDCVIFNQNVLFPNGIRFMNNFFRNCANFNQNILIPPSVVQIAFACANCNTLSDITLSNAYLRLRGTFRYNNAQQLNIHIRSTVTSDGLDSLLNQPMVQNPSSPDGYSTQITPTWDVIENGYKNDLYNIYIYTNTVFPE